MAELTIVLATYNQDRLFSQCLQTLIHYAPGPYKVLVINSNTHPDYVRTIETEVLTAATHVPIEVVHLDKNDGCAYAFNQGLVRTETPFFAFLHDDASFIPSSQHFWPLLLSTAEHPQVGVVGPALSNCTNIQHYIRWDVPILAKGWYLYGACMVFRTEIIRQLGGLDENISPCDDVELAIRVRKAHLDIVLDRRCFLMHARHQTFKLTRPPEKDPWRLEAMFNYIIQKHGFGWTVDPFFYEPDWHSIKMSCPTYAEMRQRLEQTAAPWSPSDGNG